MLIFIGSTFSSDVLIYGSICVSSFLLRMRSTAFSAIAISTELGVPDIGDGKTLASIILKFAIP